MKDSEPLADCFREMLFGVSRPTGVVGASRPPLERRRSWLCALGAVVLWVILGLVTLWAIGALWFDFPIKSLRQATAILYAAATVALLVFSRKPWRRPGLLASGFAAVLVWWLTLQPSNERPWQPDVARTAWGEVDGEQVTLHNVRNCDYRTETDYTPRWETRAVNVSRLTGLDLAINYWGSASIAHPIASFQFEDVPPVCFSIETRKELDESYSAIGGLYRQFELIYVCANERDVLRVRTNYRHREEVFLYRTTVTPGAARQRFLEYVAAMNQLHMKPRWYNAATTNCTTSIRTQRAAAQRVSWDWRILINGYADEMLYQRGSFATAGLSFADLKQRARINEAARAADAAPDFSQRIRAGRSGFTALTSSETPRH